MCLSGVEIGNPPKRLGDLGVSNLLTCNKALTCKWLCRFRKEPDDILTRDIMSIYEKDISGWELGE
ncbi:hypothetical protein Syun_027767 [Stephania yunnanensis]|uniref:Uncharacterized protein n=1 Tax=Stephania yunnanensis TaxID=152371 RepID=A0AAP0EG56_9MAGN